jgi:hypothetical protein
MRKDSHNEEAGGGAIGSVLLAAAAARAMTPADFGVNDPITLNADQYNAVTHWNTQPDAADKLTDNMQAGRSGPPYRRRFPSCARGDITQPSAELARRRLPMGFLSEGPTYCSSS